MAARNRKRQVDAIYSSKKITGADKGPDGTGEGDGFEVDDATRWQEWIGSRANRINKNPPERQR
eukprot:scaffold23289_cov74-Cyclotella_meneghiniana.AAC.3